MTGLRFGVHPLHQRIQHAAQPAIAGIGVELGAAILAEFVAVIAFRNVDRDQVVDGGRVDRDRGGKHRHGPGGGDQHRQGGEIAGTDLDRDVRRSHQIRHRLLGGAEAGPGNVDPDPPLGREFGEGRGRAIGEPVPSWNDRLQRVAGDHGDVDALRDLGGVTEIGQIDIAAQQHLPDPAADRYEQDADAGRMLLEQRLNLGDDPADHEIVHRDDELALHGRGRPDLVMENAFQLVARGFEDRQQMFAQRRAHHRPAALDEQIVRHEAAQSGQRVACRGLRQPDALGRAGHTAFRQERAQDRHEVQIERSKMPAHVRHIAAIRRSHSVVLFTVAGSVHADRPWRLGHSLDGSIDYDQSILLQPIGANNEVRGRASGGNSIRPRQRARILRVGSKTLQMSIGGGSLTQSAGMAADYNTVRDQLTAILLELDRLNEPVAAVYVNQALEVILAKAPL